MTEQEQRIEQGSRLQQIITALNLSGKDFAKSISVTQSSISQVCSGKRSLTMNTLYRITWRYSDVNVIWLLFGEGEMFKSGPVLVQEPSFRYGKPRPIALDDLARIIISIQDENAELRARIEALENRCPDSKPLKLPE